MPEILLGRKVLRELGKVFKDVKILRGYRAAKERDLGFRERVI